MRGRLPAILCACLCAGLLSACSGSDDEDREICNNDVDDDGDYFVDCADSDCVGHDACGGENCTNGVDDDGDGDVDCADVDCVSHETCVEDDEICDDGVDNDGDGLTDCQDSDCADDPACEDVENCANGIDDDGDGDIDCDDADCDGEPLCDSLEDCTNGVDDDGDGDIDCGDADCAEDPVCSEICDNGEDDNDNELIDCMDPACDFDAACEETCNGLDDDGDGRIDEFPSDETIGDVCYEGDPGLAGVGQCDEGAIGCFDGVLACVGWVGPSEELCDGIDNDCDGSIPEGEADCGTALTPDATTRLELAAAVSEVDVQLNVDTTSTMAGELAELRATFETSIIPGVRALQPTAGFGLSTFDDFPFGGFGDAGDLPFLLQQRMTNSGTAVQAALDAAAIHSGGDGPDSGIEALYQIATGAGVSWVSDWTAETCDGTGAPVDEDGDGLADCADLDCVADTSCWVAPVEVCDSGSDDDGDGYVDCDDPDCVGDGLCTYVDGTCGDGVINTGEECDDGGTVRDDGCDQRCRLEAGCGNAHIGGAEGCDDGNVTDGDGCSSACEVEPGVCGDGVLGAGEQCDDGGTDDGDGCAADCTVEADCGDGVLAPGEECDDGNMDDDDGCDSDCTLGRSGVPEFDWADGFDAGLGHGALGGAGFRETALPVIVHVTSHDSHDAADYDAFDVDAHGAADTVDALAAIGARVIGVRTSRNAASTDPADLLYPLGLAVATDALVPVCAFDDTEPRIAGDCAADECCTGLSGNGEAPDGDGMCPLVFVVANDGVGIDASIVSGVTALTRFAPLQLTFSARDDDSDAVDATCFVQSIAVASVTAPAGGCSLTPVAVDTDGDGVMDSVADATSGTPVTLEISAVNTDINDVDGDGDTAEACAGSGTYGLWVDIMAGGVNVVASRLLEVVVP